MLHCRRGEVVLFTRMSRLVSAYVEWSRLLISRIACVVSHIVQGEPTIRLVIVACRMSQLSRPCGNSRPVLDFWLSSLRRAIEEDPFWGPAFWDDIESRASQLEPGIQELVIQCSEVQSLVSDHDTGCSTKSYSATHCTKIMTPLTNLQPSRNSTSSVDGDNHGINNTGLGCWQTLVANAAEAKQKNQILKHMPQASRTQSCTS